MTPLNSRHLTRKLFFDTLSPRPAQLLHTTLSDLLSPHYNRNRNRRTQASAQELVAPGFHHVYFPLDVPASQLLPDGTDPAHLPPAYAGRQPPPRRLWAGGTLLIEPCARRRLETAGAAGAVGADVVCVENVVSGSGSEAEHEGNDGLKAAGGSSKVDVWRRYGFRGDLVDGNLDARDVLIWEKRTLIFLPPLDGSLSAPPSYSSYSSSSSYSNGKTCCITVVPSSTHLFHFSALSYNAHRIHLDAEHARAEGHRAPLVHGPLTQILMLAMVQMRPPGWRGPGELPGSSGDELPATGTETVVAMEYRNVAPLYCGEPLTISAVPKYAKPNPDAGGSGGASARLEGRHSVWISGSDGRLAARSAIYTRAGLDSGPGTRESGLERFRAPAGAVY